MGFWAHLRFRLAQSWILLAAAVSCAALIFAIGTRHPDRSHKGFVPVAARISAFGHSDSRFDNPPSIFIYAQTGEGLVGLSRMPFALVRNCRVGDAVDAERRGAYLRLLRAHCRH